MDVNILIDLQGKFIIGDKFMSERDVLELDSKELHHNELPKEITGELDTTKQNDAHHEILVDLKQDGANYITVITLATGQKGKIIASNKAVTQMYQGRGYLIPVNEEINSDEFANMKIFSDISGILDVKYVKDGFAYIIPIQHSITLDHNQRLCWIW